MFRSSGKATETRHTALRGILLMSTVLVILTAWGPVGAGRGGRAHRRHRGRGLARLLPRRQVTALRAESLIAAFAHRDNRLALASSVWNKIAASPPRAYSGTRGHC